MSKVQKPSPSRSSSRQSPRFSGRRRQPPSTFAFPTSSPSPSTSTRKRPSQAKTGPSPAEAAYASRPPIEDALAMLGRCIRVTWSDNDPTISGAYTAMIFRYNRRNGKHSLFYYATAATEYAVEIVCLHDGSRTWSYEETLPELGHAGISPEDRRALGGEPAALRGRRISVSWPLQGRTGRTPVLAEYQAVVVDWLSGTEFRLLYSDESDHVEQRDLLNSPDKLAWRWLPLQSKNPPATYPANPSPVS